MEHHVPLFMGYCVPLFLEPHVPLFMEHHVPLFVGHYVPLFLELLVPLFWNTMFLCFGTPCSFCYWNTMYLCFWNPMLPPVHRVLEELLLSRDRWYLHDRIRRRGMVQAVTSFGWSFGPRLVRALCAPLGAFWPP